jgi:hypothetical protein
MHLLLALIWLLGGVGLLAYQYFTGDTVLYIRGTNVSLSWLLLGLALYNLLRWWQVRSYQIQRRQEKLLEARWRQREMPRYEPPREPDPNFNFTDKLPPAANPNIEDGGGPWR